MSKNNNLIFDLFDLYCKYLEPYTYKIVISDETVVLVSPEDRFPHLIGLDTLLNISAAKIVEQIKNRSSVLYIENLEKAKGFIDLKFKVLYFHLVKNIFLNMNFYRIFRLPGKTQSKYILMKMDDSTEINLGIDTDAVMVDKYIPRTYLVNTRPKYYGKFIQNGTQKDILRIEQIDNASGTMKLLYDKELTENNNENYIRQELLKLKYNTDSQLIKNVMTFNNYSKKYYSIPELLKCFDDNSISEPTSSAMLQTIVETLRNQQNKDAIDETATD
jgi:hypothetical protein